MKKLILLFICAATLVSCDGIKGGSKAVKNENDSLQAELNRRNNELDEIMGTLNEIQEGFRLINEAENRVDLSRDTYSENSVTEKEQLRSDMEFITRKMAENREQIARLNELLKKSNASSAQFKQTIDNLNRELAARTQRVEELQSELASKNIRIQELDEAVSGLTSDKETLTAENEAKARTVAEQEAAMNTAWFVFGTKSELKSQKILESGGVLKSPEANKQYFTQIDIRTTKEIKLYSKKAEMLTSHPNRSYSLDKEEKGQLTLNITDPMEFWSISKYLVIQVR